MKKYGLLLLGFSVLIIIFFSFIEYFQPIHERTKEVLPTEQFIRNHFLLPNGLLRTTLGSNPSHEDWAAGENEVLSESLGLWLQYLVMAGDEEEFQENLSILKKYYVTPEFLIYWKLGGDGQKVVATNALLDDLRILEALEQAAETWENKRYRKLAEKLANAINQYCSNEIHFVDFYDRQYRQKANFIALAYIDPVGLKNLENYVGENSTIDKTLQILLEGKSSPFFPKKYDENGYEKEEEVHMIEQLYTAIHKVRLGDHSKEFLDFLKTEINKGTIYGKYNSNTLQPTVDFESPSVYALTVIYSLEIEDWSLAQIAFEKMKAMQILDQHSPYYGGYVDLNNEQSHIFDNLLPLLAERSFLDAQLGK